jgi:eukaryotic-like serine/threonine-protein kinase
MARMDIVSGGLVGGKYLLEQPLAQGGMGSVWTARHEKLGSRVAIKFMDAALAASPEFVARFEREAKIAASIESPHVVHVRDYGIDDGVPYLVMELLQGEDLKSRLRRVGRLTLPEAANVLAQVGRALRRAHEAGLVHRDLKPGNIFLARVDDAEVAKVLDFGIVKQRGGDVTGGATRTGQTLGSPHFMSPEQARAKKDLDHRSDLWALGVILFNAITGELPFPGDEIGEVFARILMDPIPKASSVAPDLPAAVDGFFDKALERDRALRFQSVDEMIDALSELAGTPRLGATLGGPAAVAMSGVMPAAEGGSQGTLKAATVSEVALRPAAKKPRSSLALAIGCAALLLVGAGAAVKMRRGAPAPGIAQTGDVTAAAQQHAAAAAPAIAAPAIPSTPVVAPAIVAPAIVAPAVAAPAPAETATPGRLGGPLPASSAKKTDKKGAAASPSASAAAGKPGAAGPASAPAVAPEELSDLPIPPAPTAAPTAAPAAPPPAAPPAPPATGDIYE